ncbi:hypothetical protein CONCODRAFT_12120 [Conidiobolus coronatus NRRL 28638]|uniref:Uncharacterized protein n=1 Tax=Conidiobolus coronatus (strain ATCC 28846 / CBS 209.66 / NRRL 28638) TaxID=796925 RepID=A0A137NTI7_CONC2|nr:hypothetical protein CONCODRAFT_12120 [Conidiobolus coronatus NRRL 28638]|eukprot:KXN66103.1 hypothetical protein CONCODRAFT_12120 [Conidiobolus coronatus NRRL 28638]
MKFQLLATFLIASIASNPIGSTNKPNSMIRKPSYSTNGINKLGSTTQYNSQKYVSKQPNQQQRLPSQYKLRTKIGVNAAPTSNQRPRKVSKNPELENLFQQIEELNSIVETEGDNLDAMKTFKTKAKSVFNGAKKFYNSPAGQKTREVVKVLL